MPQAEKTPEVDLYSWAFHGPGNRNIPDAEHQRIIEAIRAAAGLERAGFRGPRFGATSGGPFPMFGNLGMRGGSPGASGRVPNGGHGQQRSGETRANTYEPIPGQPGYYLNPEGHRYKKKRPGYYQPADPVGPNYYKPPQKPIKFDPTLFPRPDLTIPGLLPGIIPFI